uniref:WAS/WASL-interacting protein family member 3-like n=1 Tax=Nyctereutes procyonoides TaxID=34880 RepID=UPI002444CC82|nr:WAS/WASL-interacting protein family member 3-like [Nyctereutes procyonoides]
MAAAPGKTCEGKRREPVSPSPPPRAPPPPAPRPGQFPAGGRPAARAGKLSRGLEARSALRRAPRARLQAPPPPSRDRSFLPRPGGRSRRGEGAQAGPSSRQGGSAFLALGLRARNLPIPPAAVDGAQRDPAAVAAAAAAASPITRRMPGPASPAAPAAPQPPTGPGGLATHSSRPGSPSPQRSLAGPPPGTSRSGPTRSRGRGSPRRRRRRRRRAKAAPGRMLLPDSPYAERLQRARASLCALLPACAGLVRAAVRRRGSSPSPRRPPPPPVPRPPPRRVGLPPPPPPPQQPPWGLEVGARVPGRRSGRRPHDPGRSSSWARARARGSEKLGRRLAAAGLSRTFLRSERAGDKVWAGARTPAPRAPQRPPPRLPLGVGTARPSRGPGRPRARCALRGRRAPLAGFPLPARAPRPACGF